MIYVLIHPSIHHLLTNVMEMNWIGSRGQLRTFQRHRPNRTATFHSRRAYGTQTESVHVNRTEPLLCLGVVALGVLEATLHLKLLGKELMGLLEHLGSVLADETHHGIVALRFLVHRDGQIRLEKEAVWEGW